MLPDLNYKHLKPFSKPLLVSDVSIDTDHDLSHSDNDKDKDKKRNENESQKESGNGETLTKILSSHSSIYNALTNPELELQPSGPGSGSGSVTPIPRSRIPTPKSQLESPSIKDSFTIEESWQNISNEIDPRMAYHQFLADVKFDRTNSPLIDTPASFVEQARPSSLLSMTTDEDVEDHCDWALVISKTNSNTNINKSAMVFETDEEDEEEGVLDNTLIMPKVSMSSARDRRLTVTLLSSCSLVYKSETNNLINYIRHELDNEINIIHLSLQDEPLNHLHTEIIKSSNLIFIVNDGSSVFTRPLVEIFNQLKIDVDQIGKDNEEDNEENPKLTIINMMTVNYFFNLFELISDLKPYQIWKTPSLNHENLLSKFKNFVELEMSNSLYCTTTVEPRPLNERSNSMYSSLIPTFEPDHRKKYKIKEKQFKQDLSDISSDIDPLNLKKLNCFDAVLSILKSINQYRKDDGQTDPLNRTTVFAIAAAFSLGIAIGVGGLSTLSSFWMSGTETGDMVTEIKSEHINFRDVKDSVKVCIANNLSGLANDISGYINGLMATLRYTSSFMVDYARGGLDKLMVVV